MNKETINLPRLISLIANGAGVDPATARRFLHDFFGLIESTLSKGESLTIKGVGEFVRGDDPENPVLYRPDEELAAVANEPFSVFEAVELNDGAEAEFDMPLQPEVRQQPEPTSVASPEADAAPSEPTEPEEVLADEESAVEEDEAMVEQAVAEEPAAERPIVEEPVAEEPVAEEPAVEEQVVEEHHYHHSHHSHHGYGYGSRHGDHSHSHHHGHHHDKPAYNPIIWLVLGILIGILLGMVGGYFAGKTMARYELPTEELFEDDTTSIYSTLKVDAPDTIALQTRQDTIAPQVVEAATEVNTPEVKPAENTAAQPQTAKAEPVYDTITKTRYLSILARDHYGVKNYWVFIYQANPQLGDPNKVSPGTRVLIPAKESFEGATKAETDAKAQKLLNELSKKYKL